MNISSFFIERPIFATVLAIIITVAFFMMRIAPGGPFDSQRRLPPEIEAAGETNAFEFVTRHCKLRLREWLTVTDGTKVKYFRNLKDFISERL